MAQQKLNSADVGSGFEQVDGVGVAQRVRARSFFQTSALAGLSHGIADRIAAQRFAGGWPGNIQSRGRTCRQ